jgi:hypothetical protein
VGKRPVCVLPPLKRRVREGQRRVSRQKPTSGLKKMQLYKLKFRRFVMTFGHLTVFLT